MPPRATGGNGGKKPGGGRNKRTHDDDQPEQQQPDKKKARTRTRITRHDANDDEEEDEPAPVNQSCRGTKMPMQADETGTATRTKAKSPKPRLDPGNYLQGFEFERKMIGHKGSEEPQKVTQLDKKQHIYQYPPLSMPFAQAQLRPQPPSLFRPYPAPEFRRPDPSRPIYGVPRSAGHVNQPESDRELSPVQLPPLRPSAPDQVNNGSPTASPVRRPSRAPSSTLQGSEADHTTRTHPKDEPPVSSMLEPHQFEDFQRASVPTSQLRTFELRTGYESDYRTQGQWEVPNENGYGMLENGFSYPPPSQPTRQEYIPPLTYPMVDPMFDPLFGPLGESSNQGASGTLGNEPLHSLRPPPPPPQATFMPAPVYHPYYTGEFRPVPGTLDDGAYHLPPLLPEPLPLPRRQAFAMPGFNDYDYQAALLQEEEEEEEEANMPPRLDLPDDDILYPDPVSPNAAPDLDYPEMQASNLDHLPYQPDEIGHAIYGSMLHQANEDENGPSVDPEQSLGVDPLTGLTMEEADLMEEMAQLDELDRLYAEDSIFDEDGNLREGWDYDWSAADYGNE
ncbi:hypothetical protein F4805DRAFT_452780 [Annulohypoxylon moriforme]|nr:hypothetical protein F4805DRAFT_452780 [Annulohypoxylon moriforme]